MSDRQVPPPVPPPDHRPDRPIAAAEDDCLGRDGFVSRLARALVTPDGRASGVVVGLTGLWGSGKSSLLNLLQGEIERQHPGAVVVRFDPWLVSGRDDIITQFFAELVATIRTVGTRNGGHLDTLRDLGAKLAGYAKDLAPAAGLLSGVPGVGAAAAGAVKVAETLLTRERSLADQRGELTEMLAGVEVPIVVLIDELDRVEDAEVRAVAQLVRAVADFPALSYLLAYDRSRVVEALGNGDSERGAAYLEKIVQLEIPLPIALVEEIAALLEAELTALAQSHTLPEGWAAAGRYGQLRQIMVSGVLATPRDVRRVIGMFAVLAAMVNGEVDWVDLLAFSALQGKAPDIVDRIRRAPESVTVDWLGTDWVRWAGGREMTPDQRFEAFSISAGSPLRPLLSFLFPCFSRDHVEEKSLPSGLIRYRDGLQTVLRLGLLPGALPRSEIVRFLGQEAESRRQSLLQYWSEGRLAFVLDRLNEVYGDIEDPDPVGIFCLLARLPAELEPGWLSRHSLRAEMPRRFARLARKAKDRQQGLVESIAQAVEQLVTEGVFDGPAQLLAFDAYALGIPDGPAKDRDAAVFAEKDVRRLSELLVQGTVQTHLAGSLLPNVASLQPIWMAKTHGLWSEACRDRLTETIRGLDEALVAFTLICFGGEDLVGADTVSALLDLRVYSERLREMDGPCIAGLDRSATLALNKARRELRIDVAPEGE